MSKHHVLGMWVDLPLIMSFVFCDVCSNIINICNIQNYKKILNCLVADEMLLLIAVLSIYFVNDIVLESTCKKDLDENATKDLLEYNFKIQGINILETRPKKSESGVLSCVVVIQPKTKEIITRLGLALRDWKLETIL